MNIIIMMDKRPDGRKPIRIKSICYNGRILLDRTGGAEKRTMPDAPWMQMVDNIRTPGQLNKLREAIEKAFKLDG